ncbi:hypothetical protein [Croceibacterium aestuarii]|uniref:hypothetical protein n=1 Tax=Croceibacterium aestuarii TaxID=3064139 RepID=UPI00272ECE28|nr:hypothetical protein [Croceibacterium sp. D39]
MPHFHPPKPIHGWRAFFGEIAVVVIGVLIALSAEELVSDYTWRHRVEQGEEALRQEAASAFAIMAEQVAVAPCIDAQIDALRAHLLNNTAFAQPVPLQRDSYGTFVIRAPWRLLRDGAWQSLVSDGTVPHMSQWTQKNTAAFYTQQSNIRELLDHRRAAFDRLRIMADPIELDQATRVSLLQDLSEQRGRNGEATLLAKQMMQMILSLHRLPSADLVDRVAGPGAPGTIAYCRDKGLPVADWKKVLPQG